MASLKEVKGRINSVNSTRKITSAMKMVASSKLHKAQQAIENLRPYRNQLSDMLSRFLGAEQSIDSPFVEERKVERVAIVVCASNSSLCGGFNANVIKHLTKTIDAYKPLGDENIEVYAIGRKVADASSKLGFPSKGDYTSLADKPNYKQASELAAMLMKRYVDGEIDKVVLIYNHFKNTGTQILTEEVFLPLELASPAKGETQIDYIVEPSVPEVITSLLPKVLHLKVYTALLDSNASEHAARTTAMQIATDNADDLLQELTLTYNKTRQQAITMELLDIVGGSMK